jgi:hypothetical protein
VISTQKKLLYGLALLVSSSLFAHELVKATRSENAPLTAERPAEGSGAWTRVPNESGSGSAADEAAAPESDANFGAPWSAADSSAANSAAASSAAVSSAAANSAPAGNAPRAPEDVLASLERALQLLEKDPAAHAGGRLAALEGATDSRSVSEAPSVQPVSSAPATSLRVSDGRRDDSAARARLQRFLDEAPLMGMVCSESESVALFGGRAVRVGEFLLGGDGRVTACNALGVNVSVDGCDVWVALPAVRTRSAPTPPSSFAPMNPPTPPADSGAPAQ